MSGVDAKALALVQAVYLRLLDGAGLYVSTGLFALLAVAVGGIVIDFSTAGAPAFGLLAVGWLAFYAWKTLVPMYKLQDCGSYSVFNLSAEIWERSPLRTLAIVMLPIDAVVAPVTYGTALTAVEDLLVLAAVYLRTVRIREPRRDRRAVEAGA